MNRATAIAPEMAEEKARKRIHDVLGDDVDDVLSQTFFAPDQPVTAIGARPGPRKVEPDPKARPEHYKVICISFYNEDLEHLDSVVKELKRRGYTKASRSAVLRAAMQQLDLTKVPRGI